MSQSSILDVADLRYATENILYHRHLSSVFTTHEEQILGHLCTVAVLPLDKNPWKVTVKLSTFSIVAVLQAATSPNKLL